MTQFKRQVAKGFTLIEMLLVMVIIGMIVVMGLGYYQQKTLEMRIDRTAGQIQQILNAGLSYYVSNGHWPASLECLQGIEANGSTNCTQQYLPTNLISPWGETFTVTSTKSNFYVSTPINADTPTNAAAQANTLSGRLALSYTANDDTATPPLAETCTGSTCYVVATVNVPGQNLNNASAVNYAGLYHHGACVPVPQCPVDSQGNAMTPEIITVPASLSGVNDMSVPQNSGGSQTLGLKYLYPISSFTAYATSDNGTGTPKTTNPPACTNSTFTTSSCTQNVSGEPASAYWRVCVQIVTTKGDVSKTNTGSQDADTAWGQTATIAAFTRCVITNEPSGSNFNVYSN